MRKNVEEVVWPGTAKAAQDADSLRGSEATLRLVGHIRYQRPDGCGIMFDQDRSADYQQQERLKKLADR